MKLYHSISQRNLTKAKPKGNLPNIFGCKLSGKEVHLHVCARKVSSTNAQGCLQGFVYSKRG